MQVMAVLMRMNHSCWLRQGVLVQHTHPPSQSQCQMEECLSQLPCLSGCHAALEAQGHLCLWLTNPPVSLRPSKDDKPWGPGGDRAVTHLCRSLEMEGQGRDHSGWPSRVSPVGLGGRAVETMPVSILSSATQVPPRVDASHPGLCSKGPSWPPDCLWAAWGHPRQERPGCAFRPCSVSSTRPCVHSAHWGPVVERCPSWAPGAL